jgi:hypothetical protein
MFGHFFLLFLLSNSIGHQPPRGHILDFDIYVKEDIVGNLRATKDTVAGKTRYTSATSVTIKFIKELKIDYDYQVTYENGWLSRSEVDVLVNERPHKQALIFWTGSGYEVIQNSKHKTSLEDRIANSTILLFFEEPTDIEHLFSEMDGSMNTIVPIGDHRYKKVNAKGRENIYQYADGKLVEADISGQIDFKIIAKE